MSDLIDQYWEPDSGPTDAYQIGSIHMAPVQYVDEKFRALNITSVDPYHRNPPGLQLGEVNDSTFNHQPVKEHVSLEHNEALVVHKAKVRPVVVFSVASRTRLNASREVADGALLCLPIFGIDQFPREFALGIQAFRYVHHFYLPSDSKLSFEEGMISFDRSQMIHVSHLSRRRPAMKLTSDALYVLQEWFRYYSTGSCEPFLLEHQRIEIEKLDKLLASE